MNYLLNVFKRFKSWITRRVTETVSDWKKGIRTPSISGYLLAKCVVQLASVMIFCWYEEIPPLRGSGEINGWIYWESDTFYVGNLKGVGRIYQQTFVDTYTKVAHCKLYVTKTPITAADLLNDRVLSFYASQGLPMLRILTDRGTEYSGKVEQHDYQLYLAINDIEHTKTKAMSPQTNGICERFHKTILNEFYQVTFRKKLNGALDTLQSDLDEWLAHNNNERTHQGKMCNGRTPMETFLDGKRIWAEKNLSQM